MTNKLHYALYGVVFALVLAVVYLFGASASRVGASVYSGQEYNATSTAATTLFGASPVGGKIKTGYGSLGSVVITGANTGAFNLYDATTTSVLQRASYMSTSSILIASFPPSTVAGTYVFDVVFTRGLIMDVQPGNIATTTITYR